MQSNRPGNFVEFLDRVEQSARDPSSIEVVVKIDDSDAPMNRLLPEEIARRRLRLKYVSTPLPEGFYGLWRSMDDLFRAADPSAYFMLNLNDEMSFATPQWDVILRRYIGLFPDHIFRLRTSVHRARNYHDFWEPGFANDTSAIMTRRWLEVGGGWCPCSGPDTFQEYVAFYLGYHRRFSNEPQYRDIPIHDIQIGGHGASHGLNTTERLKRERESVAPWYRLMSHAMQQDASRRSQLLQAYIWAFANGICEFDLVDNRRARTIDLIDCGTGRIKRRFSYRLSHMRVTLVNSLRRLDRPYYGGGAYSFHWSDRVKTIPRRCVSRAVIRYPRLRPIQHAYMQARLGNSLTVIDRPSRLQKLIFDWTLRLRGVKEAHE